MQRMFCASIAVAIIACCAAGASAADKRHVSFQSKNDLFADYYVGPQPGGTAAAAMYVSPVPTPPHVGHTYTTYQPWMPHEYTYTHKRSHYAYTPGAGWSRSKIRYRSIGLRWDHFWHNVMWQY